jgi:VWA domain-containing protein
MRKHILVMASLILAMSGDYVTAEGTSNTSPEPESKWSGQARRVRMMTYQQEGETFYALSLTPDLTDTETDQTDLVILFDTSASQQGIYREMAFAALEALLSGLRPQDRVQILMADLDAKPITDGFVATGSLELKEAVLRLRQEAPLGSTNMQLVMQKAAELYTDASSIGRSVLYLGDGNSGANLLDSAALRQTVSILRKTRVAVSSYAIGPRVDAELLAALANQTGGNLYVAGPLVWQDDSAGISSSRAQEENYRNGKNVGTMMSNWTRAIVLWPDHIQFPAELGQTYPSVMPPLRTDRDTILLGRTSDRLDGPPFQMTVNASAGVVNASAVKNTFSLQWTATPVAPHEDYAYLAQIVRSADRDEGLSLPTVGSAGLAEVARVVGSQTDYLMVLAQHAVASGNRMAAGQITQAVLRSDPGNVQARTVQHALNKPTDGVEQGGQAKSIPTEQTTVDRALLTGQVENGQVEDEMILVGPEEESLLDGHLRHGFGNAGQLLDQVEQERRVFAQMLAKDVENTILEARSMMTGNPQVAIQQLKLALDNVKQAADLDEAKRAELTDKLKSTMKEGIHQASLKDELDRQREEQLAAVRERKMLNDQLLYNIQREKQLMDRFNSLIDERRYQQAEEVANIAEEADPGGVTPRVATHWTRMKRHHDLQKTVRAARHKAYWESLYDIERSLMPFSGEPPIVYPDAQVWEELTNRRKKYASVDLKSQGKAEMRIMAALREPLKAPLEYFGQPLSEIMNLLQEDYDIPIHIDTQQLDLLAISSEVEVTVNLRNITLRSALKLLLEQVEDLTYVIEDEVLKITTKDKAAETLQVKVYPVADLVLPIEFNAGLGGGGLGGGGGGLGGGGGGLGGGGGGFGGGGGGFGGGGGGGGGLFRVPDKVKTKDVGGTGPGFQ